MTNLAVKLFDTAASLADGAQIDWEQVERALSRESDRRLLHQLRVVAGVADVHRSAPEGLKTQQRRPAIETWGHLQLLEKVGEGSFGEVYRAHDARLRRDVALKLLRIGRGDATDRAERMLHEGRVLARIRHQNVVTVHGAEEHDGRVGLWMELIQGEMLANIVTTRGPYSAEEAALIGQDLCRALAAVHGAGLLHRDLKAQNVMREQGGRIVLMDFGAGERQHGPRPLLKARITGTPLYLAPEVISGGPSTVQSDVYGLGVLLFHLATGRFPVEASSYEELGDKHETGERVSMREVRPDLPDTFVTVLERAVHPDPAQRYASAGAFQKALATSFAVPTPALLVPTPPETKAPRGFVGRWTGRPFALVASLGLALGLSIVLALILLGRDRGVATLGSGGPSLAIRAFAGQTDDDTYFAAGLTAEIATELARTTKAVTVMPVEAVERVPSDTGTQDLLKTLGAQYLVEGEAHEDAEGGFLTLKLSRAGAYGSSWEWSFEQPRGSLSQLQQDAVGRLVRVLEVRRRAEVARVPTTADDEAYRMYLRGRYHLLRYDYEKAIELLRGATSRDPNYAQAWAALARAYFWRREFPSGTRRDQMIEAARDAANRALQIDANVGEAHGVLASIVDQIDWNLSAAHREFEDALELNPADEASRGDFAVSLMAAGRFEDARRVLERGRLLDPLTPTFTVYEGQIAYYQRDYEAAVDRFQRALAMSPELWTAHRWLCSAYLASGETTRARSQCREALAAKQEHVPDEAERRFDFAWNTMLSEYGQVLAKAGSEVQAREILEELLRIHSASPDAVRPYAIAYLYASLGQTDEALHWLEQGVQERRVRFLAMDPQADPLRSDPRFASLVAREAELQH
ncbi:MAG: protein kinase [Luteitalea sp.]|nr:protein kinase [Luteitalea sp.]